MWSHGRGGRPATGLAATSSGPFSPRGFGIAAAARAPINRYAPACGGARQPEQPPNIAATLPLMLAGSDVDCARQLWRKPRSTCSATKSSVMQ